MRNNNNSNKTSSEKADAAFKSMFEWAVSSLGVPSIRQPRYQQRKILCEIEIYRVIAPLFHFSTLNNF